MPTSAQRCRPPIPAHQFVIRRQRFPQFMPRRTPLAHDVGDALHDFPSIAGDAAIRA